MVVIRGGLGKHPIRKLIIIFTIVVAVMIPSTISAINDKIIGTKTIIVDNKYETSKGVLYIIDNKGNKYLSSEANYQKANKNDKAIINVYSSYTHSAIVKEIIKK